MVVHWRKEPWHSYKYSYTVQLRLYMCINQSCYLDDYLMYRGIV